MILTRKQMTVWTLYIIGIDRPEQSGQTGKRPQEIKDRPGLKSHTLEPNGKPHKTTEVIPISFNDLPDTNTAIKVKRGGSMRIREPMAARDRTAARPLEVNY